jgi:hypothetical protein
MTLNPGASSCIEPKPTIVAPIAPIPSRHDINELAREIAVAWQKSIAAILETGRLLRKAKESLKHGDWLTMVSCLPFKTNTAERLIKISSHPILSNSAHAPNLPPSWMTLYELTKISEADLIARIKDGTINAKMERRNVAELLRHRKGINPSSPRSNKPKTLQDLCEHISSLVSSACVILSPEDCKAFRDHILRASRQLVSAQNEFLDNDDIECPRPVGQAPDIDLELPKFLVRTRKPLT